MEFSFFAWDYGIAIFYLFAKLFFKHFYCYASTVWSLFFKKKYPEAAKRIDEEYKLDKLKPFISYGGSPRASINLALAAKAYAFIKRRGYVIPEDIRAICHDVMRHRIGLTYEAEAENVTSEQILNEILNVVEVP